MPTPDNEMLSPPAEHESRLAGRPTCPPDEARIHNPQDVLPEQSFSTDNDDSASITHPMQQPTPPPGERESSSEMEPPPGSHTKTSDTEANRPTRAIPTPISPTDETTDEQRIRQATPLSASAPSFASWSQNGSPPSPYPSQRAKRVGVYPFGDAQAIGHLGLADV
jgi:hypothetical protein